MAVRGAAEEHAAGTLSFPGGVVDPEIAEDILEATAIRELAEETGLVVDGLEYVESHSFSLADGTPVVAVVFHRPLRGWRAGRAGPERGRGVTVDDG